jgi:hypothetical protein
LTGDDVQVNYSTTSIDGKPRFTFKKGQKTLEFAQTTVVSHLGSWH